MLTYWKSSTLTPCALIIQTIAPCTLTQCVCTLAASRGIDHKSRLLPKINWGKLHTPLSPWSGCLFPVGKHTPWQVVCRQEPGDKILLFDLCSFNALSHAALGCGIKQPVRCHRDVPEQVGIPHGLIHADSMRDWKKSAQVPPTHSDSD